MWHNSDMPTSPNKIFINKDDLVEIELFGNQDLATIESLVAQVRALTDQLKKKGKSLRLIANMSQLGAGTARMRRYAAEQLKSLPLDRFALYGGSPFMRNVSKFIIVAAGKGHTVKTFNTREEALGWLLE